jgi:sulfide:quinone oxidoreductase
MRVLVTGATGFVGSHLAEALLSRGDEVVAVDPAAMSVETRSGRRFTCETLVVCPGLDEDWDATPGLAQAQADGWAASSFDDDTAADVWPALRELRTGRVVFTVPPEPAPCGATALKPLFMACDHWRRNGVLNDLEVRLVLPERSAVGLPAADEVVDRALATYGVEVLREARIERVDPDAHAVTVATPSGRRVLDDVDVAHAVPHYRAPRWIADSGLATDPAPGLADVDPNTLRHRTHPSIWGLGDAAALATRPSGGALRRQVAILAHNLAAERRGAPLQRYDGYTVVPITVGRRSLMLAEFTRERRPAPSVPLIDPIKPRRATWWIDRYALPQVYWRRILRGRV